jgi:hypothetical protein
MEQGDRFSVSFDEEGVYPFACTYHPGMTGAIVVGDGIGAGTGAVIETTASGPTDASPSASLEDASPVSATADEPSSAWPWVAGGAIGAAIGFGAASVLTRRRRTANAASV